MKVRVTAVPTVRWRCPGIQAVLCTTRFTLKEALMSPPTPPKVKSSMARTCAASEGSPQGSFPNQATHPFAPRPGPVLQGGDHVEEGEEAREEDDEGEEGVQQLPALVDARVRELVVEPERRGEDEEQDERHPGQRVAEEAGPPPPRGQRGTR